MAHVLRQLRLAAVSAAIAAACVACNLPGHASSDPAAKATASHAAASSSGSSAPAAPPSDTPSTPTADAAHRAFDQMSLSERVGQLIMADAPSTQLSNTTLDQVRRYHLGSVILDGQSTLSVSQTAAITTALQAAAKTPLLVATDQEGGKVQRLRGPGFGQIPSAVVQGQEAPNTLRANTATWAAQLRAAGVNTDLGPVLDTVPRGSRSNAAIGDLNREYGHTPADVSTHGVAVVQGLAQAHVAATVKHFPPLGEVSANTDFANGVTDTTITRDSQDLKPFKDAIDAGAPCLMVSTAVYAKIDPDSPAAFSHTIVTDIVRGDLGFKGTIISDDLGAAAQVQNITAGERAVAVIQAGVDIALTVKADDVPLMFQALLAQANQDPTFKSLVDTAALTVLETKQNQGLLK